MNEAVMGIMLGICAAEDWTTGRINVWYPAAGAVYGLILRIAQRSLSDQDLWLLIFISFVSLAAAAVSGGRMGIGDGIIVTACGILSGGKLLLALMAGAVFAFLAVGAAGILMKKWTGNTAIPFIPFLWGVFLISCLINLW